MNPLQEIIGNKSVCHPCALFIANGDLPDEPRKNGSSRHWSDDDPNGPQALAIIAGCEVESQKGGNWCLDTIKDGDHEDFDTTTCDCCGSSLGGSRWPASVVYQRGLDERS